VALKNFGAESPILVVIPSLLAAAYLGFVLVSFVGLLVFEVRMLRRIRAMTHKGEPGYIMSFLIPVISVRFVVRDFLGGVSWKSMRLGSEKIVAEQEACCKLLAEASEKGWDTAEIEEAVRKVDSKKARAAFKVLAQQDARRHLLLADAVVLGCEHHVDELLRAGSAREAEEFIVRARVLLMSADRLGVRSKTAQELSTSGLDAAQAVVVEAERRADNDALLERLKERVERTRADLQPPLRNLLSLLAQEAPDTRGHRKAFHALEKELSDAEVKSKKFA